MEHFFGDKKQEFWRTAEQQVLLALDLLDAEVTRDYRQANAEAPELVQAECRPIDFLRTEDFNPYKAAVRMAGFWTCRKSFFGPDRWLLPTRLKEGAMTEQAAKALETGFLAVIKTPHPVFIVDYSRLPGEFELFGHNQVLAQCLFYTVCATTCEAAQTKGFHVLHVISKRQRPLVMPANNAYASALKSLPFRVAKTVIARTHEEYFEHLLEYRALEQERIATSHRESAGLSHRIARVEGASQAETLSLLEQQGFDRACLPLDFGGDVDLSTSFPEWLRQTVSQERLALPAPYGNDSSKQGLLVERLPNETVEEFKKRRNAIYGRRNTQKTKRREAEMEAKRVGLIKSNQMLAKDNQRLESLLAQAEMLLLDLQATDDTRPTADSPSCFLNMEWICAEGPPMPL